MIVWLIAIAKFKGQTQIIVCPSKLLYHIPCPGCGITRATIMFFKGDFIDAILFNPNVILSVLFLFGYPILGIFSILTHRHILLFLYHYINDILSKKIFLFIFFIFEVVIWINNIYRDF